jgi:arginyl-tRNA synthetase
MDINIKLKTILKDSLKSLINVELNEIEIKQIDYSNYGDYYTNIALLISKKLSIPPLKVSKIIISNINKNEIIEKIKYTEPGFIIFFLKKEYLLNNINNILKKAKNYGKNNMGQNKNIILEFITTNKTELLTINQGREITYLDNLARIMSFCNYNVTKEYYIKDSNNNLENLEKIKKNLDIYRINFNNYTCEKILNDNYSMENILTKLRYSKACYIQNDTICLKTSDYGASEDVCLIQKDGNYTIILPLITYQSNKIDNNYHKIITTKNINSPDNLDILKASLKILEKNPDIIDIKNINNINLLEENKNLNLIDLIEKLGINTTRYYLSSFDINNDIDLNLNSILTNSNENSINYVENTYIKICTILKKNKNIINKIDKYTNLNSTTTYNILKKLYEFSNIIKESCKTNSPNIITTYIYELTKLVNAYYSNELIIEKGTYSNETLIFLNAIKIVLNNALNLIGIIPREEP